MHPPVIISRSSLGRDREVDSERRNGERGRDKRWDREEGVREG
jgi:hypothetical protein